MTYISRIEFWKSIPFQEGNPEVPSPDYVFDNPDLVYDEPVHPARADLFSRFDLPVEYFLYLNVQYVRVTFADEDLDHQTYYGYIDDVSLKSSTDRPLTSFYWHIDLWYNFVNDATFGYGLVQARPASETDPPQTCSYRYRLPMDFVPALPAVPKQVNWLLFTYVAELDDGRDTDVRTCFLPLDPDALDIRYAIRVGTTTYACPTLAEITRGDLAEVLGISASQITSAFVSPIPPIDIANFVNGVFVLRTEPPSGGERIPERIPTESFRRETAITLTGYADLETPFHVHRTYSDGTESEDRVVNLKPVLDGMRHVFTSREGEYNLVVNVSPFLAHDVYAINLRELVSELLPNQVFTVGDYIESTDDLYSSRTTTFTAGANRTLFYNVSLTDRIDQPFTYNGSWPDVTIYCDHLPSFTIYVTRAASEYAVSVEKARDDATAGYAYTVSQNLYEHAYDGMNGNTTTDTREYILTDMSGTPVAAVPWGITLGHGTVRVVMSSTSAYIQYRFDGVDSVTKGTEYTVPLPSVDVCSNSWNDYVYSGQKAYDCEQRRIAAEQALVNGITSTFTGATSNTIMASIGGMSATERANIAGSMASQYARIAEKEGGDYKTAYNQNYLNFRKAVESSTKGGMGLAKAAGASLGIGIAASAIDYATTLYYNGQLQHAEDTLQAKQFDAITIPSTGWDWLWHGRPPGFTVLVPDGYSLARFQDDRRLNGIFCSEPTEDCTELVRAGGPLRITSLVVKGDIPVQARAYIKARLENGVRIIKPVTPTE